MTLPTPTTPALRRCTKCKTEKAYSEFYTGKRGVRSTCKQCDAFWSREDRKKYPDKYRTQKARYVAANRERHLAYHRERNAFYKRTVMEAYGGKCACCGETGVDFLCIDHVDGGGTAHRRQLRKIGVSFYRWLIKNLFPTGLQILCANCNLSKYVNGGVCMHQGGSRG